MEDDWTETVFLGIICHLLKLTLYSGMGEMCFVLCLCVAAFFLLCVYLSLWIFVSFVADLQGLWTEAHQRDRAPQWQLPSAAGPWPVPRCLRRWSSRSAHSFLCTARLSIHSHSMNRPTVLWLWPKAFKAQCMCTWASAVQGDSDAFLVHCCWIAPIISMSLLLHSFRLCIHCDISAFKTKIKIYGKKWIKWNI